MRGLKVDLSRKVEAVFSADDWQLYDDPGRDAAAASINRVFSEAVNSGKTRSEVEKLTYAELLNQRDFGAADSEGMWFLQDILEATYGS